MSALPLPAEPDDIPKAPPPASAPRPSPPAAILAFAIGAVVPFVLFALATRRPDMPDYGTWTGIRPLEQKLRLLAAFAETGEVDAVLLGSSVADLGMSAERLSERLSQAHGRPFRAFNFGTGAAEVADFPELYRLVRTVARPKSVVLVVCTATARRSDQPRVDIPQTPVYYLSRAPVWPVLESPFRLRLSRWLWEQPPLRHGTAAREWIVYGSFKSFQGVGSDTYRVNAHGDRVSFTYEPSAATLAEFERGFLEIHGHGAPSADGRDPLLADEDVAGLVELRQLTEADGATRMVVAHERAAVLGRSDPVPRAYADLRKRYFDHIAALAGAARCTVLDDLSLPRHALADYLHLNSHGAATLTDQAASCWGGPAPATTPPVVAAPDLEARHPPETFNTFSFVLVREADGHHPRLRLRFVRSVAVPPMPSDPLFLALRLPDGRDIVVPAGREGADVIATVGDLGGAPQVLVGRLVVEAGGRTVALNQPLAAYRWEGP